jgi:hypothetical protein
MLISDLSTTILKGSHSRMGSWGNECGVCGCMGAYCTGWWRTLDGCAKLSGYGDGRR